MQLCRQVERAVALALAGECHDEVLRELTVETVQPAGGTTQLVVQLRVPDVLERLDGRAARLRLAVASAISRKRVPTLTLICLPAAPVEGGGHA
jgi:ribosome-binding factor A